MGASNDNDAPPVETVTVSELAALLQIDEDRLLQRLAEVLCKKKASTP